MILVNGIQNNELLAGDRGLAYGDGLFETLAVVDGDVLNWSRHVERLGNGCERLAITRPDFAQLLQETHAVAAGHDRSVVKITITRGVGGEGYTPPLRSVPTRIVARRAWPEQHPEREQNGVRVCVARHRLSSNPALAGLKHLNRLDQVLASMEIAQRNVGEALMLDLDDRVIEATRCNLFAVDGNRLLTPRLDNCGVRGIMRAIIMRLAPALDLMPVETDLTLEHLRATSEMFLCNAIAGIWPVTELIDAPAQVYAIGPCTRRLQTALLADDHHR